jgi:hypothetical protein
MITSNLFCTRLIVSSVAEPPHFYADLAPSKNVDGAPAPSQNDTK